MQFKSYVQIQVNNSFDYYSTDLDSVCGTCHVADLFTAKKGFLLIPFFLPSDWAIRRLCDSELHVYTTKIFCSSSCGDFTKQTEILFFFMIWQLFTQKSKL